MFAGMGPSLRMTREPTSTGKSLSWFIQAKEFPLIHCPAQLETDSPFGSSPESKYEAFCREKGPPKLLCTSKVCSEGGFTILDTIPDAVGGQPERHPPQHMICTCCANLRSSQQHGAGDATSSSWHEGEKALLFPAECAGPRQVT